MLKEINSSKDVITNVDLFNEIIELVKNSKDTALMKCEGELPPFVDYAIPESYVSGIYDYEFDPLFVLSPGYNEYYMITAGTAQYKNGLSFAELQSIFANLGCTYARSMDGGGSSSLVVNGKLLNTPAQYDERPVVDFLSFLP